MRTLSEIAAGRGKYPWLIGRETLTFDTQCRRIAALETWFEAHEVAREAPVLLAVSDDLERASLLVALLASGRVPVVLDPELTLAEVRFALGDLDLAAILSDGEHIERWQITGYSGPRLHVDARPARRTFGRLLSRKKNDSDDLTWPGIANARVESRPELKPPHPDALAYVIFTSGSTARPKGVEITHRALCAQLNTLEKQYALDPDCRLLNTLPLHHVDGFLQGPVLTWYVGGRLHRPMEFSVARLGAYMDVLYTNRITHLIAVPAMLALMVRLGSQWKENLADEAFRFVSCSGAGLDETLWRDFESLFDVPVVNMYGLSETGTSATFSGPDDASRCVGTVGLPVNCSTRIVDEKGQDVAPETQGELLIASDQLMRGYHGAPEATAEVLVNGWFRTGDLVQQLPSGHIVIVGRRRNVIITGGRNVSPEEVAGVIARHDAVSEAVVVGRPDAIWGEQIVALVIAAGAPPSGDVLAEWCREALSEHKIPRTWIFLDELPRTASGKVRLQEARRIADSRHEETRGEALAIAIADRIIEIAARVLHVRPEALGPASTPGDTPGWDSLAHMELVVESETEFGIELSAEEIMAIEDLGGLERICRSKLSQ